MHTGSERFFNENEIIVSKTDLKGFITYANEVFLRIADYSLEEVMGKPHNLIRNPNMPKGVFKLLWDRLKEGKEIFAYVVNQTKFGDYYWVLAHVTPSYNSQGEVVGYHSNRRSPRRDAIAKIEPIYKTMLEEESKHPAGKAAAASMEMLLNLLKEKGISYDEFILSV